MFLFGDTLIRIKNAKLASKEELDVFYSKLVLSLVTILKEIGFIKDFKVFKEGANKKIKVTIDPENLEMVNAKLVSKPGKRIYLNKNEIKKRQRRTGRYLISTSKGLLTDQDCVKNKLGGEVMCRVW